MGVTRRANHLPPRAPERASPLVAKATSPLRRVPRGFTPFAQRELRPPGHLGPCAFETCGRLALPSVRAFGGVSLSGLARHVRQLPREFTLLTKQMLYFDRYAKALAPEVNLFTDPRVVGFLYGR